jgi:hypothetical protein
MEAKKLHLAEIEETYRVHDLETQRYIKAKLCVVDQLAVITEARKTQ